MNQLQDRIHRAPSDAASRRRRCCSRHSGSACSAESNLPSPALTAMKYNKKDAFSALRISFWRNNSSNDIQRFADALKAVISDY